MFLTRLDAAANWARTNSLWPMPFATACCGIELMATAASRHDIARFGAEVMRFSPRQCDLMIVAGRVVMKMLPGAAADLAADAGAEVVHVDGGLCVHGRRVRYLCRGAGRRSVHSGRYVRARLPAAAGAVDAAFIDLQDKIQQTGTMNGREFAGADAAGRPASAGRRTRCGGFARRCPEAGISES